MPTDPLAGRSLEPADPHELVSFSVVCRPASGLDLTRYTIKCNPSCGSHAGQPEMIVP